MFLSYFIFSEDKIVNDNTYKIYRKMMDKLHDEILGKDFILAPWCNNITGDEIIVEEVIERYKELQRSNRLCNNLLILSTVILFTIMILLIII